MKKRFWLYRRASTFYLHDSETGTRRSLGAVSKEEAERLRAAKNEAARQPLVGLAIGRAYLASYDPKLVERTWSQVMEEFCGRGQPQTQARKKRAIASPVFDPIRAKRIVETTPDDLRAVLGVSGAFANHFLRCIQNLALALGWLPWAIIPSRAWPSIRTIPKRAITREEHHRVIAAERNPERRLFYELLWEIGASQSDAASLTTANVDWSRRVLRYKRKKTGEWASLSIGQRLEVILRHMPASGPLFPHISKISDSARSAEFYRRCRLLGLQGISLHSYRYAWAQRAKAAGYPERWAQNALGHGSRAVHAAYSKGAVAVCPPLEEYENEAMPIALVPAT